MPKRQYTVLNMMILVLTLCVVFFACMPVRGYAAGGTELEWGYGNPEKGVIWVLKDGTMTVYLNNDPSLPKDSLEGFPEDLPAPASDEEKAVTQLFKNTGTGKDDSYRKVVSGKLQFTDGGALKNKVDKIVIRDGITGIGWKAKWDNNSYVPPYDGEYKVDQLNTGVFQDFDKLTTVETCSSIQRIGWSAFRRCSKLSSFDFSKMTDLEEIMNQAFSPCDALTKIDLSNCTKLKTIRQNAFDGSKNISGVILPDGLETVGQTAFKGCNSLEYVKFGDTSKVKKIGAQAFQGTSAGTRSKLAYVTDEKTKRKAVVVRATPKLFGDNVLPSAGRPDDVFWFGALEENFWDLDVTVKDKTVAYNGEEQKGYEVSEVTGTGSDPVETDECKVTGLHKDHVLTLTGYKPSYGTDPKRDPYDNGSFDSDPGIEAWSDNYDYGINYELGTMEEGKLTIQPVVKFVDDDGETVLKDAKAYAFDTPASDIEKPADPTKKSTAQYDYTFDGWEPEVSAVTGNATYKAKYKATLRKYDVKFVDDDGSVIKDAVKYDYGTEADNIKKPADPTKESTAQYDYTFAGWNPEIADVTGDATYKATYTETVRKYDVKFVNYNGTVLQDTKEEYGSTPSYDGSTPTRPETKKYTYKFKGWTPDISEVTGDATYKAEFTAVAKPEPAPADDDDNDGGNGGGGNNGGGNGGGGGNAGGTVTPAAPAGTDIDDGPVPAADTPDTPDTPDEPADIDDQDVPLAENGGWALVNLLCMLATAALFVFMLVRSIRKRREGERSGIIFVIAGLIVAVFAALVFFMTEDLTQPMIMTDRWTLLMAIILAVQLAVTIIFRTLTADGDEEE